MTAAQRRATKRHRERHLRRGLKRLEVRVPADQADVIRKAAEILRGQAGDAGRLRAHLGFERVAGCPKTALDIFAMPEPLSAQGEALWDEAMAQVERERKDVSRNRMRKLDL